MFHSKDFSDAAVLRLLEFESRGSLLADDPEFVALCGCEQEPSFHPEGDVWRHTSMAVDAAFRACEREGLQGGYKLVIVLAALFHDIGKPETTAEVDGRIRAFGHAERGAELAEKVLRRWGVDAAVIARVVPLVRLHMKPGQLYNAPSDSKPTARAFLHLVRDLAPATVEELCLVCEADRAGRETAKDAADLVWLRERVREATTKET